MTHPEAKVIEVLTSISRAKTGVLLKYGLTLNTKFISNEINVLMGVLRAGH
jgi:hypothetical protein